MARSIFASFYYDGDAARVQQVLNMGAIEGDSLVTAQAWETVKYQSEEAIKKWIHEKMLARAPSWCSLGRRRPRGSGSTTKFGRRGTTSGLWSAFGFTV